MQTESLQHAFGQRVQLLRKLNHMTQEELGDVLGCSTEYVSRIERGVAAPSFKILAGLARVLRVEVNALFDFTDGIMPVTQSQEDKDFKRDE